tara:strand:+ start:146 stop:1759 length:1614 start_codon:yes stop_codon:yes gene_type:complete
MYLIIIILISNLFSQNFAYKNEDWIQISNPGNISSMSIMNDQIIISSSTGIFSYHVEKSSMEFMNDFIRGFSNGNNSIIHYDKYRDHLWYVNNEKIYFKSYISTIWREIEFSELGIGSSYIIDNIGSDFNYIFIKIGGEYLILDPYSGKIIENDEDLYINLDGIIWSASSKDLNNQSFSLNKLVSTDGYNIISNQYIEKNNHILTITSVLNDSNNNIWVGTNSGELFQCDLYSNTMTLIKNIPHFSNLNYSLLDDYGEWWFSTNDERILNDDILFKNDQIFLSNWDEYNNKWNYYKKNDFLNIISKDITCMYRFRDKIYLGTNQGCLIYNIKKQNFKLLKNKTSDSSDYYVFKIVMYKNYIYMATSEGVKIVAINNNDLIIDYSMLNYFDKNVVYSIEKSKNNLFIASDKGLYRFDDREENLELISDNIIYNMDADEYTIIASNNNKIFYIKEKLEYITKIKNIRNLCLVDDFIWINNHKNVHLYNIIENETYEYDYIDGIAGNLINHLDCDDEWVWFSTNNGLSIFNWSKYHFNEK